MGETRLIGFIGLGNVGGKLAGNYARSEQAMQVHDLDAEAMAPLLALGAAAGAGPAEMMRACDIVITCLPSPAASAAVLEGPGGLLEGMGPGKIWMEMSTTDAAEVRRLGALVEARGGRAADCPVSGGCHRAATGNIAILAGCDRATFEAILPVLTVLGRDVLHAGGLGDASVLKVVTNYLATANLVSLTEALTVAAGAGMDLGTTYEAIRISSGNSFVHETESQVILNGSRRIDFTMDLVQKDVGLFEEVAARAGVPLELAPLLTQVFADGAARFGGRAQSPSIIRRLEEATGLDVRAPGFPADMADEEPPGPGREIAARR
ncbi:MAG: NAD(P)-dependent oxidoreductase [Pseudomonadota bacterium]